MKTAVALFLPAVILATVGPCSADTLQASPPARSSLEIYDLGYAWITELRRVGIAEGAHEIVFQDLPASIVPGTAAMLSSGRSADMDILEQRFNYSLASSDRLLNSLKGQAVEVTRNGDTFSGVVLRADAIDGSDAVDVLLMEGDLPRWIRGAQSIKLLKPNNAWAPEPRLVWSVNSRIQQAASLRLTYQAEAFDWHAVYNLVMEPGGEKASMNGKVGLENHTALAFRQARVTLVRTEQGGAGPLLDQSSKEASQRLRYSLSNNDLRFEQQILGPAGVTRYTLDGPVTLEPNSSSYIPLVDIAELPVALNYIYDGVVFDNFQRNRRNDWNYGTESQPAVDVYLSYEDLRRFNVKEDLPGGQFRVFERGADGGLMLLGDEMVGRVPNRGQGQIRIGSAPNLIGARERIGYAEITPHHEYEESFEIRLENMGEGEVTIKVIEHLYRWPEYEIVKSDSEYEEEGPQKISFKVLLKPGGSRSLHYSVRYRW